MSRQISDLIGVLTQLTADNRKLLVQMESQHNAMKAMDLDAMAALISQQEATRLRITALDNRRKMLAGQIATTLRIAGDPTISKLAEHLPQQAPMLRKTRDELRAIIEEINRRTHLSGKLSAAVLGHLNTVSRLVAGAVERAGVYTKQGVRRVGRRIGVMDAVG
ncbi:MAG: flagellar protein FlgN [Planctomycetota bacterium]|nr:flagellar protein FlgN [Planctomycetota bacterium]